MILRPDDADVRYEVATVDYVLEGVPEFEGHDRPTGVISWVRREFKTSKAAHAYAAKLQAEGKDTMFRVGVTVWLPPDEAARWMQELQRNGVTWR